MTDSLTAPRPTARGKILTAAADLARESGPGKVSLEAVASRAGVSKGGLLYHFPSKAKLMQGLVEDYLDAFSRDLDAEAKPSGGSIQPLLAAYVRLSLIECEKSQESLSWVLAAMAADPDFLKPIEAFKLKLLDRLKAQAKDPAEMLVIFLALEGLRSLRLFNTDILSESDRKAVVDRLLALAV